MKYVYDYKKNGKKTRIDKFVLLSKSPRRKDLLKFLNPEILPVEVDERRIEKKFMDLYREDSFLERAAKTCCEISLAKSDRSLEKNTLYISADTIVIFENKIYNKPRNLKEARDMFLSYFGKSHHVVTSICLRMEDFCDVFYTLARIDFVEYYAELNDSIEAYLSSKSYLDKAGAYGIQDLDPRFIRSISGDINTIIGLPVSEVSYRIFAE